MYYHIQKLSDMPVVFATWYEGFQYAEHGQQYLHDIHELFDSQDAPVFYVLDMSQLHSISFEGMANAANSGTHGVSATLHHPMNRGTLFVSDLPIIKAAAKGLNSAVYGNVFVQVFATLNEALGCIGS